MKLTLGLVLLVGCTDAQVGKWRALGNPATVKCYSGGVLVFEGRSSGAVSNQNQSDGWVFVDSKTGKVTETSGACIIVYDP